MQIPSRPLNEEERLATLRELDILDTPSEERFDRLTRLARRLFNVSVALVSLVDVDRQWFKSVEGLCFRETSRDTSFCGHAILEEDLLVIPDALADERFYDNPLVIDGPRIRFYAGCPLTVSGGIKLGSFCLMDTQPRDFSEDDRASLRDIGQIVVRELIAFELATKDMLTGMANRQTFRGIAEHALNICRQEQTPAVLVYFDLDNFKSINDRYGHAEGDRALVTFADSLHSVTRESDVTGRVGGDEFIALFIGSDGMQVSGIISRLRQVLDNRCRQMQLPYAIQFSAGDVPYDAARHASIARMIKEADRAMYVEKRQPDLARDQVLTEAVSI